MDILENESESLRGRVPTDQQKYYLENAYKEPVESIGRIEETAKFLVGAVSTVSGIFAAAVEITSGEDSPARPQWFPPFLFWAASVMVLLLVLLPRSYTVGQNEPAAWRAALLQARTVKYRWLVAGAILFVVGLIFAPIVSCF